MASCTFRLPPHSLLAGKRLGEEGPEWGFTLKAESDNSRVFPLWLMALAVVGYLVLPHFDSGDTTFVGQAQLVRDESVPVERWQINADVRNSPRLAKLLGSLSQQPTPPPEGPLWSIIDGKATVQELPQPPRPETEDPLFPGGPRLVAEWKNDAQFVQAILYQRPKFILAGRLRGAFPSPGLIARPPGEPLSILREVPADLERLAWINISTLQLPPLYKEKLEKAWQRWEFFPLRELGPILGPGLALMEWNNRRHVLVQLRDTGEAQRAIDRRFSSAVVKSDSRRSYGVKVEGFDPEGPAWYIRGDSLTAVASGGTKSLAELLSHRLDPEKKAGPLYPELTKELERLAGTEPGWHVCLIDCSPEAPFPWAALIRWPAKRSTRIEGFLVIDMSEFAE